MRRSARSSRFALALVALWLAPHSAGQDLAAVAKKEKDRRAKVATPVKVLTEEDGKEAGTKGTGSVTISGDAPAHAPASQGSTGATDPSQRAAWKARADRARQGVTAAESTLVNLEKEVAAYRSDIAPPSAAEVQDPMRLQKRDAKIFEMNKQIEAQKAAVVAAKKALADFEDEARRSGVPAGWLR